MARPAREPPENNVVSGDSWMYPYQRTPMGNPYISPTYCVLMGHNPQESLKNHNKYNGRIVRGTPKCPLIVPRKREHIYIIYQSLHFGAL